MPNLQSDALQPGDAGTLATREGRDKYRALQRAIESLGAVEVAHAGDKTPGGPVAKMTIYAAKSPTSGTYLLHGRPRPRCHD